MIEGSDFCDSVFGKLKVSTEDWGNPYFVQSVGESIVTAWGRAYDAPEVDYEFVATGSSLSFWYRLEGADKFDR